MPCVVDKINSSLFEGNEFRDAFSNLIKKSGVKKVAQWTPFKITNKDLPWQTHLMDVKKGQEVTFLLAGRWYLSREADAWVEPGIVFFARINRGEMFNPSHNTGTLKTSESGSLSVARSVAQWNSSDGTLGVSKEIYLASEGEVQGIAIVWNGDAHSGLKNLLAHGDVAGLLQQEFEKLQSPALTPSGWKNHFNFGEAGTFKQCSTNEMCCQTHKNVAILQHDVDHKLAAGLKLNWNWMVSELPSKVAEDTALTHDYLSIAVEFDDGQDITYLWSSTLPEGKVFRCPLPVWDQIETHVVQRTGLTDLGKWLEEERDIASDYATIIGGNASRVVRVWLLGVSIFQRNTGVCRFAKISISGDKKTELLS
tara:strand:- start:4806 stop:5906 length:1101 start_codon:yes stop_codon:yes gene_type:complete